MRLLLFLSVLLCSGLAWSEVSDSELASQRFHYQKAKLALAKGETGAYEEHFSKLGDYPLKPYLEFSELRSELKKLPFEQIDRFFANYPNSFLEDRLRVYLLHHLASRGHWQDYLKYYDGKLHSVKLRCNALYARIKTKDESAFDEVPEIWDVGKSQPDACDKVFSAWIKAGLRTEEHIWSRFHKAIQNRKTSLARYLSKQLKDKSELAKVYLDVHSKPHLITQRKRFTEQNLETQQIISHGIMRLARKKPLDALYHWEMYEAQQVFPEELALETKLYIVKRLIREGHSQEAQHLLAYSHSLREKNLVEEVIREALREQDWQRVNDSILLLSQEDQRNERWQYWRARSQDALNVQFESFPASQEIYRSLSVNRSFYGFLSADKLLQQYSLVDDSRNIDPMLLQTVSQLPGMGRARESWITGNAADARAEWIHTSQFMDTQQLLAAGQLARDWGWYNTGIQAMIHGDWWNQLTVRFPLAFREQFQKIAEDTQLPTTYIYAIARQESAFDAGARSPVGAMGLMQLMPQTARFTAKTFGINHQNTNDLLDAEHNMRLGSHYLTYLLEKYQGNRILATAAYNAGPHRVNRWLSDEGKERPYDVWIETIPFGETRQYVQNVLCFTVIYGYRLGEPVRFVSNEEAESVL